MMLQNLIVLEEPKYSCQEILNSNPRAVSGEYSIYTSNGTVITVYCKMENTSYCGEGGWTRIAYINMTQPGASCPNGFVTLNYANINHSLCGNYLSTGGCNSTFFNTNGLNYSKVCGQMRGYQYHSSDGFHQVLRSNASLDDNYVCGYSITRGTPRQHIWTYAGGIHQDSIGDCDCPCNIGFTYNLPPSYVGNDYYCESGLPLHQSNSHILHASDPLWDGQQCLGLESPCCTNPNLPWFYKPLGNVSNSDIEVRLCLRGSNVPFDILELYVK